MMQPCHFLITSKVSARASALALLQYTSQIKKQMRSAKIREVYDIFTIDLVPVSHNAPIILNRGRATRTHHLSVTKRTGSSDGIDISMSSVSLI